MTWEIIYSSKIRKLTEFFNARIWRFLLVRLANISMNSKRGGKIREREKNRFCLGEREEIGRSSRASRYLRRRAFWYGFLLRYVKDWRLTPVSLVTVSRNPLCEQMAIRYLISSGRYSTASFFNGGCFHYQAVSRASIFCRSPCRKISDFLSWNLVTSLCRAKRFTREK